MRLLSKVSLFENVAVMQFVPGNDIREGAHGNVVLVGDALTCPIPGAQVAEQCERRCTNSS